jgi:hypothetical protein
MTEAEGDEIVAMVLRLVRAVHRDAVDGPAHQAHRPPLEPVHVSPVYRLYESLVGAPEAS